MMGIALASLYGHIARNPRAYDWDGSGAGMPLNASLLHFAVGLYMYLGRMAEDVPVKPIRPRSRVRHTGSANLLRAFAAKAKWLRDKYLVFAHWAIFGPERSQEKE